MKRTVLPTTNVTDAILEKMGFETVTDLRTGIDPRDWHEAIGFIGGRLVHLNGSNLKPVTPKQAVRALASMESMAAKCQTDGEHEPAARAKFFRLLAKNIN